MDADRGPMSFLTLAHGYAVLVPRKFEMLRKIVDGRRILHFKNQSTPEWKMKHWISAYGLRNRQMSSDPRKRQIPSSKFIWVRLSG